MATIQTFVAGESGFSVRQKILGNDANINTALEAAEALLQTDNASLDDFQKITDAIEAIQATLSVNDAAYDTLQEIIDKLKTAETKLATIETGAEVNVQADWNEADSTNDAFIDNKPAIGTVSGKDVGIAAGNIQENGANLGNSETVETDATGKFITASKNTAYNKDFGTGSGQVAEGDASYLKTETYTKAEADALLATKENTANKGVANGYASLDSNAQVPLSQIPANAKSSKVVADIATRDVIATADRFEGLRVHVLDASADSAVTSGSAGYILKSGLTNSDWEKTYESESLDIDLSVYLNKTTETLDDVNAGTTNKHFTATLETKLNGIEDNATADQSDAEIKTAYENNVDTNPFTDAFKNKLTAIEQNATADQSDLEIKTAYESNVNTNAFTDAEKNKLANLSKADVGLGNVDNTSDADKPISTAQQTALDADRQTALNNLTNVGTAVNGYVLTKDPTTGNAEWKPDGSGGSGTNLSIGTTTGTTLDVNSDTGTNATLPAATPSNAGLLTSADKTKLDGIEVNAASNKTGSIVMSIASSVSGALKFDGVSSYSKTTYSSLYTILSNIVGTDFDVDANNFYLPDPAGRVLGIAGSSRTLFDLVGSDTHLLDILEMPEHKHDLNVWSNSGNSFNVLINGSDGSAAVEDIAMYPAGGNQPHNIVQKTAYIAQNLFIYF
jgi:hypothetical protein